MTVLIICILAVFSLSLAIAIIELASFLMKRRFKKSVTKDMLKLYRVNLVRTLKEVENGCT
jgi:hypothetical protein